MNKLRLNCPKLIRFHELTEDEVFCTEAAAKAGVTFENTVGDRAAGGAAVLRPGSEPGRPGAEVQGGGEAVGVGRLMEPD